MNRAKRTSLDSLVTRPAALMVARAAALVAIGATLLVAGCAARPPAEQVGTPVQAPVIQATDVASNTQSLAAAVTTPPPAPVPVSSLKLKLTKVTGGLTDPLYVTGAGDGSGRLFVVEQQGRIRVVKNGALLPAPYLDIRKLVSYGGERGLLGLAFAPNFARSGRFYVNYTDTRGNTAVVRYRALDTSSDAPAFATPQKLLGIAQPYANHNGGCLQFGPDGMLYIGMGDGGSGGDPGNRAQRPGVLLGKILRIDVSGRSGYGIPPSNPRRLGWAPEVAMIGVRNPWRFSFDASSGAFWMGDVGQNLWEEIDYAPRGRLGQNWGWHNWEGSHAYPPGTSRSTRGFTFPIYNYKHPSGESITGGYVYRGAAYPAMNGTYIFGDYVNGWVAALRLTAPDGTPLAKPAVKVLLTHVGNPSSFGQDDDRELYMTDLRGNLFRVEGTGP